MAALGDKLAEARAEKRWSLREVERRTGIHNAHLSQIETGRISRPSLKVLWQLADVYELGFREVLGLAGHDAPPDPELPYEIKMELNDAFQFSHGYGYVSREMLEYLLALEYERGHKDGWAAGKAWQQEGD